VRSRGGEEGKQRIERLLRNPPTYTVFYNNCQEVIFNHPNFY